MTPTPAARNACTQTDMPASRVIYAMRQARRDGHSHDREAIQFAERNGLIKFVWWPAGYWQITDAGSQFIFDNGEAAS